jgi:hypothetical protein
MPDGKIGADHYDQCINADYYVVQKIAGSPFSPCKYNSVEAYNESGAFQ